MKPDEFWNLTFREFNLYVESYNESKTNSFKENVTLCYIEAYFQRVQKMPNLEKFLNDLFKDRTKAMTDEMIFNKVQLLNKVFGGKEIKVGEKNGSST